MGFANNITFLAQQAVANYVRGQGISFNPNVYTSLLTETAVNPCILVKCSKATCEDTQQGSWKARVRLELRENKDDTTDQDFHLMAGEAFSIFMVPTIELCTALSSNSDFTVFHMVALETGWDIDGRLWVGYFEMDLDCCGSDIS